MTDSIAREKIRVDTMRRTATDPVEQSYWQGYRRGLVGPAQEDAALRSCVGSADLLLDGRGRGYVAARRWRESHP